MAAAAAPRSDRNREVMDGLWPLMLHFSSLARVILMPCSLLFPSVALTNRATVAAVDFLCSRVR